MNGGIALLASIALSCGAVFSVGDLDEPIQYVDHAQSSFIAVDGTKYRMGTAVDAINDPSKDMSQFSGQVEDCSTHAFWCRSIAYLKLVVPKARVRSATYQTGAEITIKRVPGDGWHASATCWRLLPSGCSSRVGDDSPMVTYQYDVSAAGYVTAIQIQYRSSRGAVVDHDDLQLSTKLGLRLN